jgi:hypothetical protein
MLALETLEEVHGSSHRYLDAGHLLAGDVVEKTPVVLRMGRCGQGENLFGCVRDKQFLASNTDTLPAMARIHFCRMRL